MHGAFFIVMMGFILTILGASEIKRVHNSLEEIQSKEGKLQPTLVREWSGEAETDENKIFSEPKDVVISDEGDIYVLDANRIQAFDKSGNYLRTIGRNGLGPGDLSDPTFFEIDKQKNLIVVEKNNQRIQIFSSKGDYRGSFLMRENRPGRIAITQKNEILVLNRMLTTNPSPLWLYYDYQGQILREIGERKGGSSDVENAMRHEFAFSLDERDNLFASAIYKPLLQKYSSTGELQLESAFEVPFEVPEIKTIKMPEGTFVEGEAVSRAMDIDSRGRIFLLALTRIKSYEEKKVGLKLYGMRRDGKGGIFTQKMKFDVDPRTNLYQILVFNDSGKIVASKKLNVHANNIRIHKNRLFLIDSYIDLVIREFEISIQ
jgi:hypothetical protein